MMAGSSETGLPHGKPSSVYDHLKGRIAAAGEDESRQIGANSSTSNQLNMVVLGYGKYPGPSLLAHGYLVFVCTLTALLVLSQRDRRQLCSIRVTFSPHIVARPHEGLLWVVKAPSS